MSEIKELKARIDGIRETQKITNAMYLISSSKLRHAKEDWSRTEPYFRMIRGEIKRIFRTVGDIDSPYFYPSPDDHLTNGTYAYLVITADKGLAGAYNHNVIKETVRMLHEHSDAKLFVVGEYGRHYCQYHNIPIEQNFIYTAQNPTLHRAREISDALLGLFNENKLKKIYVIYTDYARRGEPVVCSTRILPFHHMQFDTPTDEKLVNTPFSFVPSVEKVLENMVSSYVTGFIYSALTDSFCCEQNARMVAMDAANRNAQKILEELSVHYHRMRQGEITQEITEISAGAKYHKIHEEKRTGGELQ